MLLFEIVEQCLQQQLKELCDFKGREINPDQSAVVLNNLGLLYRCKSPDKISLIQSAALLNAAIVRQPENKKFQNDLKDLCRYVLEFANASDKDADLLQISNSAVTQIKEMRNMVRNRLKAIKKVPKSEDQTMILGKQKAYAKDLQSLQRQIANDYKRIMANISRKCIQTMGELPCKYALVGMGSLARDEITPYSDFEHIIVLQNLFKKGEEEIEMSKEYFRWYSVLFHIVVINLKETYIPKVCVPCLNDSSNSQKNWFWDELTPSGISFDSMKPIGCKIPLGRTQHTELKPWTTELIKPVDEMVKYLDVDEDLKNGYKLGDILTRTCFVEGDELIYQQFSNNVASILKMNSFAQQSRFHEQLKEDLENFDLLENLTTFIVINDTNIKRVIYRSITLFVSALGRLQQINQNSTFAIVEEYFNRNIFSDFTSAKLKNAVAVACHIRLVHYMNKKCQQDDIHTEIEFEGRAKLQEMTNVVSAKNLVDALSTANILQLFWKKNFDLSKIDELFQCNHTLKQIKVMNFLGLFKDTIRIGFKLIKNEMLLPTQILLLLNDIGAALIEIQNYSKCLEVCEKYQSLLDDMQDPLLMSSSDNMKALKIMCFVGLKNFPMALKESDALLKTNLKSLDLKTHVLLLNGVSKFHLYQFFPALSSFRELQKLLNLMKMTSSSKQMEQMKTYMWISNTLLEIGRKEQGLHVAREGLNYVQMIGASSYFFDILATIIRDNSPHIEQDTNNHVLARPIVSEMFFQDR